MALIRQIQRLNSAGISPACSNFLSSTSSSIVLLLSSIVIIYCYHLSGKENFDNDVISQNLNPRVVLILRKRVVEATLTNEMKRKRSHLLCRSMDWFLYDRNLRHERVKRYVIKRHETRIAARSQLQAISQFASGLGKLAEMPVQSALK